jgi:hypothetical protein
MTAKPQRNRPNHPHVRCHVFADDPVPASDASNQSALLIRESDAQAVNLELRYVRELRVLREPEATADAAVELAELVLAVGIVEAEHRHQMRDGLEAFGGPATHALCRRVGVGQLGVCLFDRPKLAHESVELGVGDLRRVVHVVALFVMADESSQFVSALGGTHIERTWEVRAAYRSRLKT